MTKNDTAAVLTAGTVHQAMGQGLTLDQALALVATATGATVAEVEALTLAGVRLATQAA